jgi:methanogenic corrinoid protein MtbC1
MVYIRSKKIKGIDYAYLVRSIWDQKRQTSRQETIKYLGKTLDIAHEDIPNEYRNDPKITAFLSSHSIKDKVKSEKLLVKLRKEIFNCLVEGNPDGILKIYDTYTKSSSISDFYEKLLNIVMYEIGDLWEKNKLSTAMEHVASNVAHSLVKVINEKTLLSTNKCDVLICTPEGEWHNLGCDIIESVLKSKGYRVFNMSPSAPHDSILGYIQNIDPDVVLISVTLKENITSCQRLIKKIRTKSAVQIMAGGQALKKAKNVNIDAILIENNALDEISRFLRTLGKK